ncbi:MAG: 50S ribosomal protein L4 [Maricaulaceae bacterium]
MKLEIKTLSAESAGEIELADAVFGLEDIRKDLLHRMVRWQLARRQRGTRRTKTRGEIARTKQKMYRQKGTGNARHGNRAAPQFVGGGRAHGPQVRSHDHDLPKKVRALALRHALSAKALSQDLVVIDQAVLDAPKTKALRVAFEALGLNNALIIGGAEIDGNFALAARNFPEIDVLPIQGANVYDILRRSKLVLTREAAENLQERLA